MSPSLRSWAASAVAMPSITPRRCAFSTAVESDRAYASHLCRRVHTLQSNSAIGLFGRITSHVSTARLTSTQKTNATMNEVLLIL
jgi:hypothetical protein